MPKKMEKALKEQAAKKGFSGERADAYVYGAMRKTGWKPGKGHANGGIVKVKKATPC